MNKQKYTQEQKEILAERTKIRQREQQLDKWRDILRQRRRDMRNKCPHNGGSTFHYDPAGGNDSWEECELCGGDCR